MFSIKEVESKADMSVFLKVPDLIYQKDNVFVKHLDQDILDVFDKLKNPFFQFGDAKLWIAYENKKAVGRIAAFYHLQKKEEPFSGLGFFECVNNKENAHQLFDTAVSWLKKQGQKHADAPVNFGQRDSFWGLLVSGFKNPSYRENYNPAYYQDFFESYGFEKVIEQTTSEIKMENFNYERFSRLASRVLKNERYEFRNFTKANAETYCRDFITIYNQAWEHHDDFQPLEIESLRPQIRQLFPILPETLNWFAYADGEPAGIFINVLDVNQVFKKVNGKMNLIGKLKFLLNKHKINRVRGIVFGIIPKYQGLGLEVGMIMKFHEALTKPKFSHVLASELAWVGDFNPKMLSMFESMGAKTSKLHYTYRKEI